MSLDIDALLSELTLEEKASLTSGSAFWYTAPVERLGIPKIMVSDGPHGLRAQPGEGDHVGLGRQPAGDLLPDGVGGRLGVEPGSAAPDRGGAGAGGAGLQPVGHPRARGST